MAVLFILPMTIGARSTKTIPVLMAPMAHKWLPQAVKVAVVVAVAMMMMRTTLSTGNSTMMDVVETRVSLIKMTTGSLEKWSMDLEATTLMTFPTSFLMTIRTSMRITWSR